MTEKEVIHKKERFTFPRCRLFARGCLASPFQLNGREHRGVDLISDALPFGRLWYAERNAISNAVDCGKVFSRSHRAVIRVYDEAGNVIETHQHMGDFKKP